MSTTTDTSPSDNQVSALHSSPGTPPQTQPQSSTIPNSTLAAFSQAWQEATSDNTFTLHGFRRFRTSHLLNLRFLEREIADLDHQFFQAGLRLDQPDRPVDKLGLKEAKLDQAGISVGSFLNQANIQRCRDLIAQYDQALLSYNQVMRMETFSLADNLGHAALRPDLNPYEMYKTRLVKADAPLKRPRTPMLAFIHTTFRAYWYYVRQRTMFQAMTSTMESQKPTPRPLTYQNTIKLAETVASFLTALTSGVFMIVPVCILSFQHGKVANLVTISISIVTFSLVISLTMRTSGPETVAASAAYAAVLVVFLSTNAN